MTELTKAEVLLAIQCGIFDEDFDEVISAIDRRRKAIVAARASELQISDQFYLRNILPKELVGLKVEVIEFVGRSKVRVTALGTVHVSNPRYKSVEFGDTFTIHLSCVGEKL